MLNCTVCGHENLPVTDATIYGFASGHSLQMVERCHKCGARVAERCLICRHLHPLGTTHCSLSGIKIQDFIGQRADVNTRLEAFRNSDGYGEIIWWRRFAKNLLVATDVLLATVAAILLYGYGSTLSGLEFENFLVGAMFASFVTGLLVIVVETQFCLEYFDSKSRKLWHKMGNREWLVTFWGELKIQNAEVISLLEQKVGG